ncbi:MAG: universal stress protein [Anaerolineae bacterium]
MAPIVCATRGGEAGRQTQERAIVLAKERGSDLIFLCVCSPVPAGDYPEALASALVKEQQWLDRALLTTARARAQKQGIDAGIVCLTGPVMETIQSYLRQVGASTLVLGQPKVGSALAAFQPTRVRSFAEEVRLSTDVEVIVVTPEG